MEAAAGIQKQEQERERAARREKGYDTAREIRRRRTNERAARKKKESGPEARFFAKWCCENLLEGARDMKVVDVAGGRGDLAYALSELGVGCCVVDPMPLRLDEKRTKRMLRGLEEGEEEEGEEGGELVVEDVPGGEFEHPWQRLAAGIAAAAGDPRAAWLDPSTVARLRPPPARLRTAMRRLGELGLSQHRELFDDDFVGGVGREALAEARALVGMHPDEATEAIADCALGRGLPFAVVPCCVFPGMFPDRKTPEGGEVRSLEQFREYLKAKDPGCRVETLEGLRGPANVVVYHLGTRVGDN
ncbi:hypothetical protein TeGR_g5755 [Tetraparma gracilis]|uniref:Uncharacterized protein n=1 Tax=Tetraparma gracilis TaxID=2962635 RepID=A0ABQ6MRP3_9STRA|nr:hypothetical protein TeGR_g5755 [Tetraparma gracilis]